MLRELSLAGFVERGLQEAGFAVDRAADGEEGLGLALTIPYDAECVARGARMPRSVCWREAVVLCGIFRSRRDIFRFVRRPCVRGLRSQ